MNETLDVSRLDALPDFYDSLNARGWTPDILVNNAGMNISKPALETTPEEFSRVLTTNLDAPFFLATEFARPLIEKGQSRTHYQYCFCRRVESSARSHALLRVKIRPCDDDTRVGARMGAL